MKLKPGFTVRQICGENVLMPDSLTTVDYSFVVSLNETALYLYQNLLPLDNFETSDMVALIKKEYEGVTDEQAQSDCQKLIDEWLKIGLAE